MIEFKAECGHVVRAKDEDAGGVVRCSYCGRKATVPDEGGDDLDFLFAEVGQPKAKVGAASRRKRGKPGRLLAKGSRGRGSFNPFALVLRMCYAALLICIVVFVGKKWVIPLIQHGFSSPVVEREQDSSPPPSTDRQRPRGKGLAGISGRAGLFVGSTPPNATFYCIEESKATHARRISEVPGHVQWRANTDPLRLAEGVYAVEVIMPTNDIRLNNRSLPSYEAYRRLRYSVRTASDEECRRLLEEFFVPDKAWPVFIDKTEEKTYIVRQYRGVTVGSDRRSSGVRALFLPKIMLPGGHKFSVAQLVTSYLPKERTYVFDEQYVREELEFFHVPKSDRTFVLEGLARIGVMPYVAEDGNTRLAKLGIHDGECWAEVVRETSE